MVSTLLSVLIGPSAIGVSQGIEALLQGTGKPSYNALATMVGYVEDAVAGYLLDVTRCEKSSEDQGLFEACNIAFECMNEVPELKRADPYEQFKMLLYVEGLTRKLKDAYSGVSSALKINFAEMPEQMKKDYQAISVFYKILAEKFPAFNA